MSGAAATERGWAMSDKILPHHLQRKAMLYIRQSSAFQVQHNTESRKLQYAMKDRLGELGWRDVEVVDEDLGRSAAGGVERTGFERMVAEVCLGRVGTVAAREVSRFARNSREWQQLVEVCRIVDTLLIDQETVYSPRHGNDRLLLGLKGSLNEYELDLLRQRGLEARREKAKRGELVLPAPVGFLNSDDPRLERDPDLRVRETISLVFRKFLELGSVRQTLMWFLEEEVRLPVRHVGEATAWKRATYARIYRFLTLPAYGGAYAYGKTEVRSRYEDGKPRKGMHRKPVDRWLALIPHAHEGYISWEQFQQIQGMIAANVFGSAQVGAAKGGTALLAGLLRCRRCGRKMLVLYTGRDHAMLRYVCRRGQLDQGEPRCIGFGGVPTDAAIGRELAAVVRPGAVEAAIMASRQAAQSRDEVLEVWQRDLEAARYAARRAEKQFNAADPENRLVAQELERRWDEALRQVEQVEHRIDQHQIEQGRFPIPDVDELKNLAGDLDRVWNAPHSDARLKKRIVRALIDEVVADVDADAGEIILIIHWKGGVHTELRVPRRRRGCCQATSKDIVASTRILARICSDKMIAGLLNRNGLHTGRGNRWTQERVASLRSKNDIPCFNDETIRMEGWMNLSSAAAFLGVAPSTVRAAVEDGTLTGEHPLADGPWVLRRSALETDAAKRLVARVRERVGHPAKADSAQETFGFFGT